MQIGKRGTRAVHIGSTVVLQINRGGKIEEHDATVIGIITEKACVGPNAEPALNLSYLNSDKTALLTTADWHNAFDRLFCVRHVTHDDIVQGRERYGYYLPESLEQQDCLAEYLMENFPADFEAKDASAQGVAEVAIRVINRLSVKRQFETVKAVLTAEPGDSINTVTEPPPEMSAPGGVTPIVETTEAVLRKNYPTPEVTAEIAGADANPPAADTVEAQQ